MDAAPSNPTTLMSAELQALKEYVNWESGAQNRCKSTVRHALLRATT